MAMSVSNHMRGTLSRIARSAAPFLVAGLVPTATLPAYAEDAVEQLGRLVNEQIVMRPTKLGLVKVVVDDKQMLWTEIQLLFDDLRPDLRRLSESLGWQPNEVVPIRISRDFSTVVICRRDVVEGC